MLVLKCLTKRSPTFLAQSNLLSASSFDMGKFINLSDKQSSVFQKHFVLIQVKTFAETNTSGSNKRKCFKYARTMENKFEKGENASYLHFIPFHHVCKIF